MDQVALVTGGSSGIGLAAAQALSNAGYRVYALSRHGGNLPGISHLSSDVTDISQVSASINKIMADCGRIDVVVNCAGFGISGAIEFTDASDAKRLFDVDFFGMVNVNNAVIPLMRKAGGGRIINVSSVAAPAAIPFQAYYSCAKAAVNDYTCALANELRPFHIGVCAVMPGDIKTGFTAARKKLHRGDDVYGGRIGRSVAKMEHDEQTGMKPETAGEFICRIAGKKRVKPLYTIGFQYQCITVLLKILPCGFVNRMISKLYIS